MVIGSPAPPRPLVSQSPAAKSLVTTHDVVCVLLNLKQMLEILNSGLAAKEAVHGLRLLEPRNDLSLELKEISWWIARLSGVTDRPCPTGDTPAPAATTGPFIRLDLQEDGRIAMRAWKDGRFDSSYPPNPLERVLLEISAVVQELQPPNTPSSPDEHAR